MHKKKRFGNSYAEKKPYSFCAHRENSVMKRNGKTKEE